MGQPGQFAPRGEDWIARELQSLRRDVQQLAAANPFATMGITPKTGGIDVDGFINSLRADGTVSLSMDDAGAFIVYNGAGAAVARFGELVNSNPGQYGVEILYNGAWVQVGAGNVDWGNISNKPASYTAAPHTHPGTDVTSRVAESEATDGVTSAAYNRNIAGTPGAYLAVYMHENGDIGYNTSDERYKKNIRDFTVQSARLMGLRAVLYDRKATDADDYTPAVSVDELGLIAGETDLAAPELAIRRNGELDGVLYERLPVFLLPFVQAHEQAITDLRAENTAQAADIAALKQAVRDLGGNI